MKCHRIYRMFNLHCFTSIDFAYYEQRTLDDTHFDFLFAVAFSSPTNTYWCGKVLRWRRSVDMGKYYTLSCDWWTRSEVKAKRNISVNDDRERRDRSLSALQNRNVYECKMIESKLLRSCVPWLKHFSNLFVLTFILALHAHKWKAVFAEFSRVNTFLQ